MTSLKKTEINAILGEEFNKLLEKLGVLEEFKAGKYRCVFCGDQLSTENVLIVFPLSENNIGFVCKKPECMGKYKSGKGE
jgi:hypothetical protein